MTVEEKKAIKNLYYKENAQKCRAYQKKYRENNKEKEQVRVKSYANANKEKELARKARYRKMNTEKIRVSSTSYARKNRDKLNFKKAFYNAKKFGATIYMTKEDKAKIAELYTIAKDATKLFGYNWEVDHIIPLNKGGLHKLSNLQVVPESWNRAKGDRNSDVYWG